MFDRLRRRGSFSRAVASAVGPCSHCAKMSARRHRGSIAQHKFAVVLALVAAPIALTALSFMAPDLSRARDTTALSDRLTQDQRDWVRGLKSGSGVSCCDDADGIDPVWDISAGRYRVRYGDRWLVVQPDAVLTQPNRLGVARAWLARGEDEVFVRCFLPGPTT